MHTWPIARYRFDFDVQSPIRLPEYAGSMLRGAFGNALRRTACMTRETDCKACPLYRSCSYPAIFETPAPETHALQKFSQIPNPYIIEPPPWGEHVYQVGERLSFTLVLIGRAIEQLPLITFAWQRAFKQEVGRGTAVLHDVHHLGPSSKNSVFDTTRNLIIAHDAQLHLPAEVPGDTFILNFHTPLRLQENGHALSPDRLTARDLLMALARRTSLLMELHTGQSAGLNFAELASLAPHVPFTHELTWRDWTRFSSRQQQSMQLGGATGRWTLRDVPLSFHSLLQVGQWLHIGKNATFGLGGYSIGAATV